MFCVKLFEPVGFDDRLSFRMSSGEHTKRRTQARMYVRNTDDYNMRLRGRFVRLLDFLISLSPGPF